MLGDILFPSSHLPLLAAGAVLVVGQLIVLIRIPAQKDQPGSARMLAWGCVLILLSFLAIALLMVIRTHTGKILTLDAVSHIAAAEKAVLLAKGVSEYKGYWLVGGGLMILTGVLGVLSVWLARRRLARFSPASPVPLVAVSGLGAAMVILGTGLIVCAVALIKAIGAISYADAAEKTVLMEYANREAPKLLSFVLAALGAVLIAGIASTCLVARVKDRPAPSGKWAMVVSIFVLIAGAILFVATRPHARDADAIPELFEQMPRQGEILFTSPDIVLPELEHTQAIIQAPVITASEDQVSFEGISMGSPREIAGGEPAEEIPELFGKLEELRQNYSQQYPPEMFPAGIIILQFDRHVDARAAARVWKTCYLAGYRKVQVATDGAWTISSAVLGEYKRYRPEALAFELVAATDEGSPDPSVFENFEAWMKKIDRAAAHGPVQVPVTGGP